ncbi:MAG: SRPBCC family protein [Burkholderiales bacterium]
MKSEHYEARVFVPASVERVFSHLDDHKRLSSHMSESSWKMGGGRMSIELDAAQGKSVGSCIRLSGRILGMDLGAEEVVTERSPPLHKVWETTGVPKLLVIGHYRMGFDLTSQGTGSIVRVFIDYVLPEKIPARWLGNLFGKYYAKWCTRQMVDDAVKHFASIS